MWFTDCMGSTLGNYCQKLGQVNVPLSPVLLLKLGVAIFLACEGQKYARLSPPLKGEWNEYTISSREIRNPRGQRFVLIPSVPYSVLFSKNMTFLKKHLDASFN